jgi:putative transposase
MLISQAPLVLTVAPYNRADAQSPGQDTAPTNFIPDTNAIESINARIRRAVRARGHFPTEAAAIKCVYMALMSLDPTGQGRKRWTIRWKAPLNAFQIAFEGRLTPANI